MLRWLTAGESHGPSLVAILEGLPAHVRVTSDDIADSLARRRLGYGRGARMKFEQDEVTIVGGVRHGESQGGPVAINVGNTEWPKWEKVMSADPVGPGELKETGRNAPLTRPRPGHADLAGMMDDVSLAVGQIEAATVGINDRLRERLEVSGARRVFRQRGIDRVPCRDGR